MTYERMKFMLGDYLRCRKVYDRHVRELALMNSKLEYVGISIDYSKPRVKGPAAGNAAYAEWITEAMFLSRQLETEAVEVSSAREKTKALIDSLDDAVHKDVLRYKYINGWRWDEIARVMGYSVEHTRHTGYEAVRILAAMSENKKKITTHNHL